MRSARPLQGTNHEVRLAPSFRGGVPHIVDDWSCELASRRKNSLSFCGQDVHPGQQAAQSIPVCRDCEAIIRRMEREIRERTLRAPDEVVTQALKIIIAGQEAKMAEIIPFRPRLVS